MIDTVFYVGIQLGTTLSMQPCSFLDVDDSMVVAHFSLATTTSHLKALFAGFLYLQKRNTSEYMIDIILLLPPEVL